MPSRSEVALAACVPQTCEDAATDDGDDEHGAVEMTDEEPQGNVDTFFLVKWFLIAALTIGAFALLAWFALDAIFKFGEGVS